MALRGWHQSPRDTDSGLPVTKVLTLRERASGTGFGELGVVRLGCCPVVLGDPAPAYGTQPRRSAMERDHRPELVEEPGEHAQDPPYDQRHDHDYRLLKILPFTARRLPGERTRLSSS